MWTPRVTKTSRLHTSSLSRATWTTRQTTERFRTALQHRNQTIQRVMEILDPKMPKHLGAWLHCAGPTCHEIILIGTVGIDTGPTGSAQHVYQTKDSHVRNPWTVEQEQTQEELPGHIVEQPKNGLHKMQAHSSSHRNTSRMDKTRNDHRERLQQQRVQ